MDQPIRLVFDVQPERKIIDLAVGRIPELLQSALDVLPIAIAIIDAKGCTVAVNATARQYVLETQGRHWLPGEPFEDSLKACPAREVCAALMASLPALISGEMHAFERTYEVQYSGQTRVKQLRMARFLCGGEPLLVMTQEDVTTITSAHREVDVLSRRLLATQEDERKRIALELHDSTGQHLVATSLALAWLPVAHEISGGAPLGAAAAAALADAAASVGEAQKEIRLLSYLLHPPNLERDGLAVSVSQFVAGFGRRSGLECRLHIRQTLGELDFELQRSFLRVVQEALINIHRHADATLAEVELSRNRSTLMLEVRDDGHGLGGEMDSLTSPLGVGIPGMRARLHQFGGTLEIIDTAEGLTVRAHAPIKSPAAIQAEIRARPDSCAPRNEPDRPSSKFRAYASPPRGASPPS